MTSTKNDQILRGNVYWVNLDPALGSEIQKTCPALVISNNIQNRVSTRIIVIPITSNTTNIFPFESKIIINNREGKALTDQIRTIDKSRIGNFMGKLSNAEIADIEKAIKITLSLD